MIPAISEIAAEAYVLALLYWWLDPLVSEHVALL
jgi:hypothetical protein